MERAARTGIPGAPFASIPVDPKVHPMTTRQEIGAPDARKAIGHAMTEYPLFKAALASLAAVLGTVVGSFDVVFWGVLGLWALDMVAGIARAIDQGEEIVAEKARSGFLRAIVYMVLVSAAAISADVLIRFAQTFGLAVVPGESISGAVWFVCGWVAYSEILSIGRNADHFYPGAADLAQLPARLFANGLRAALAKLSRRPTAGVGE